MANSFSNEIYRSPKVFSYLVIGTLAAMLIGYLFQFILSFVDRVFVTPEITLKNGQSVSTAMGLIGIVAIFEILFRILTIVFF